MTWWAWGCLIMLVLIYIFVRGASLQNRKMDQDERDYYEEKAE